MEWVSREVDRKAAAIEMESAGVCDAAIVRTPAPRTFAIRGISDYADTRKEKIEKTAKGLFRGLSAKNAMALFVCAVEAGVFGPDDLSAPAAGETGPPGKVLSRAKSIFVIGGATGETADVDAETPRLNRAFLKLGAAFADAGAQRPCCALAVVAGLVGYSREDRLRIADHWRSASPHLAVVAGDGTVIVSDTVVLGFQLWLEGEGLEAAVAVRDAYEREAGGAYLGMTAEVPYAVWQDAAQRSALADAVPAPEGRAN